MHHTVHNMLMTFSVCGRRPIVTDRLYKMIEIGVARISDPSYWNVGDVLLHNKPLDVLMDEPLAIAAALMFFKGPPASMGLEKFTTDSLGNPHPPTRGHDFLHATSKPTTSQ